jgi:hypothetical protein
MQLAGVCLLVMLIARKDNQCGGNHEKREIDHYGSPVKGEKRGRGSALFSHYPGESTPQDQGLESEFFLRDNPDRTSF